jgi:hypothetical protein
MAQKHAGRDGEDNAARQLSVGLDEKPLMVYVYDVYINGGLP